MRASGAGARRNGKENAMANYKIVLQYDGTRYKGWQILKDTELTIQGKLSAVLHRMAGHPVEVIGSGRTDAGVHAFGQTANFHLEESRPAEEILSYLNRYLPEDIAVISAEEVDERFHSRYHAVEKTYLYRIHTGEIPNVFERRYLYDYSVPLDAERMREAARFLCGTHDFKSFCANKKMKKSTVRTIFRIEFEERPDELRIFYTGSGFLQGMVRILTGTLIEVGNGRRNPSELPAILEAGNREAAGYTAPACGLALLSVSYDK